MSVETTDSLPEIYTILGNNLFSPRFTQVISTFPDLLGSNKPIEYFIFVNESIWIEISHVKMLVEACGFSYLMQTLDMQRDLS